MNAKKIKKPTNINTNTSTNISREKKEMTKPIKTQNKYENKEVANHGKPNSQSFSKNRNKRNFNNNNSNSNNSNTNRPYYGGRKNNAQFKSYKQQELEKVNEFNRIESERENIIHTVENKETLEDKDFMPHLSELSQFEAKNEAKIDDNEEKVEIVGVRFKPVGKIYFFGPGNIKYEIDDKVIVETSRGVELGYIVIKNKMVSASKIVQPLKHVQRKAIQEDIDKVQINKELAKQALKVAEEKVRENGPKMKLIEAEYTFDNSKLLYYFTAETRVDFRDLVKDLASVFRTRIEMRQIGVRDQTQIVGGLSICGRPFCCNSFLQDFGQVTIKMAKEQNIQINSAKISGACGRLMCCLRYEHDTYEALYKDIPKVNTIVETSSGEVGVVIETNVLTGVCRVRINPKNSSEHGANMIKPFQKNELKSIGFVKGGEAHNNDDNSDI